MARALAYWAGGATSIRHNPGKCLGPSAGQVERPLDSTQARLSLSRTKLISSLIEPDALTLKHPKLPAQHVP